MPALEPTSPPPPSQAPRMHSAPPSLSTSLFAGAVAGTTVDVVLFPLDTLKTRLQSTKGLTASGGLCGLYSGLSSTVIGSAPSGKQVTDSIWIDALLFAIAALFFVTYESIKQLLEIVQPTSSSGSLMAGVHHLVASCAAEVSACTVRVPIEVLKQRMQVSQYQNGLWGGVRSIYRQDGLLGFYRGFQATLQREIPFASVQFPLYEWLKYRWRRRLGLESEDLSPARAALCGSLAGGVTAAITTPLDVIKTRIILGAKEEISARYTNPWQGVRTLWREGGLSRLFAGVVPRVTWISLGGFIFFGSYEKAKQFSSHH